VGGHQRLSAVLVGSLDQTVEGSSAPAVGPALAMVIARLLVWSMQPAHDARPGDRLEVLYDTPAGQEPLIQALAYRSQKNGAEYRAYRYQRPGARFAHYYRADGSELEERLVGGPIDDYEQVTSLLRDGRGHKGVDFKAPLGTPIHSPVNGTILRRNWHWRANGNSLEIVDAQSGRHVIFLHLEEVPKSMKPGAKVHVGEQVALSGNTGHTTAPHLHYQLMSPDGRVLDPFKIHKTERQSLPADQLPAFKTEAARLDALLHVPPV
jgi:murein DD-endopeptidase